jgi:PAS domain S-box-containing protein
MSDHNAYQNHGIQVPVFTSASQNPAFEEHMNTIDLNEIFADFLNDSADPLMAYNNLTAQSQYPPHMQHHHQQQQQNMMSSSQVNTGNVNLPTGRGIITPFHTNKISQPSDLNHPGNYMPNKRVKHEDDFQQNYFHHQQQQQQQQHLPPPSFGSALSGKLGFSVVDGRLNIPQNLGNIGQYQHHYAQQHEQQQQQPQASTTVRHADLPVGIGIQLGNYFPQSHTPNAAPFQNNLPPNQNQIGNLMHSQHNSEAFNKWGHQATTTNTFIAPNDTPTNEAEGTTDMMIKGGRTTTGGKSEHTVAIRRQRNREHAKRSRVRKKFLLESLQAEVKNLQNDNLNLRLLIQKHIPINAQKIIDECCKKNLLFADEDEGKDDKDEKGGNTKAGGDGTKTPAPKSKKKVELLQSDFNLIEILSSGQQNFVLSDPRLPGNPIVFASEGFYQLTGYTRDQVLGRNCRFLQGPGTDPKAVEVIRTAIANGTDATTCILNYKADGTPFWNQFYIAALRDADNCIVNYVGVQCKVDPEAGASMIEDKVNAVMPLAEKGDEDNDSSS